jgi:hypothetical protein
VLRWWLVLIAAQTLSGLATLAALFSTSTALVFSLGAGVCCVFVLMLAPRLVTAVTAAHHAALS